VTRTVVVTGAGAGLGADIARAAASAGWRVALVDRDGDAAARVLAELGAPAIALVADTTDEQAVDAALDRLAATTGEPAPDALVANAGIVRFGPLLDVDLEAWRSVVDVNLTGTFVSARAVARRMAGAERGGSIVAVTSMNGVAPGPNAGAYGSTKAGVARLVQQMALEWGPLAIRANAVAPGLIDGGMSAPIYADPDVRRRRSAAVPLGRLGVGAEVAAAVLFLLSDDAAYITGTELLVDGGVTMSVIATLPRPAGVDGVGPGAGRSPGPDAGDR
jgi:NAD(P)-dependent dehydrogenase (short-subunit alcohol dehydrogenase family)